VRSPPPSGDTPAIARHPASFRDPAGFVYRRDGVLLRQVDRSFATRFEAVRASGILTELTSAGALVPFEERPLQEAATPDRAAAVIRPSIVDFVSYPFEWAFSQLQDAALLTLDVQRRAVARGMRLRDASAYNVQFHAGRPILIDTLSFEPADPTAPWPAYRQFCQHFLAPLAIMSYRDPRAGLLLRDFIDGIPLDLAVRLVPGRTRWSVGLGSHLHLHARAQRRHAADAAPSNGSRRMSRLGAAALLDSLRTTTERLRWRPASSAWAKYDESGSYAAQALGAKEAAVTELLSPQMGSRVWDLGANVGRFSRIASSIGYHVVAWDGDPDATEQHYRAVRQTGETRVLPLLVDLTNPSPALGWALEERRSLLDRADADVVLALALVHHLAIGANVPLDRIFDLLARVAPQAIVEWVPKSDPMAERLLASREDIFHDYTPDGFRAAMSASHAIRGEIALPDSERIVFLLERTA
jgi:hypothetical protein